MNQSLTDSGACQLSGDMWGLSWNICYESNQSVSAWMLEFIELSIFFFWFETFSNLLPLLPADVEINFLSHILLDLFSSVWFGVAAY